MGFNFRKSFKIAPEVRLNVGKQGITGLSLGGKVGRITVGKKGVRSSVSALGTGMSYSQNHPYKSKGSSIDKNRYEKTSIGFSKLLLIGILLLFPIIWIESY